MQTLVKEIAGYTGVTLVCCSLWYVDWRIGASAVGLFLIAWAIWGVTR